MVFFCLLAIFLSACAAAETQRRAQPEQLPRPEQPPQAERQKAHAAARLKPEAEKAFAGALALWGHNERSPLRAEVCADPKKARALLGRVIELEPGFAPAYARRGLAESELGLGEEAFDDLTRAVRLAPTADNYSFRALASMKRGQGKAARRDLDYALTLDSGHAQSVNFLGLLELGLGDGGKACSAFEKGCAAGDCSFIEAARGGKICP
jgi:tetratricopeptide (TPR) repeat protein